MQPLCLRRDLEPGLVQGLRAVRARQQILQPLAALPPTVRGLARHALQRGRGELDSVHVLE